MSRHPIHLGLHNHTNASDGFFTPQQLLDQARQQNYEWLVITDHNTVHSWLGLDLPSNVAGGIEMSGLCERTATEVHLLGYGLTMTPELLEYSQQFYDYSLQVWLETLVNLGVKQLPQSLEERSQAIQALMEQGISAHTILNEACRIQGRYREVGKAPEFLAVTEAVNLLHRADGKVSVAHPQRYPQAMHEDFLERVDALEVYHPSHSPAAREHWRSIALRLDKQVTGGHDFHGWNQPHRLPQPLRLDDERLLARP
ncbi:PHP domain-containing protein [Candidatus Cyanaurora vandensis]|uniref:PHP domain-containing protein n=1 Tax=Candidatus Cyanaurora vandensis TaxID=2714958 RepID=UPI00257A9B6D|nr:hypothetical protein [Candidatus Cyanaurora vandensis]